MKIESLLSALAVLGLSGCAQIGGPIFLKDEAFTQRVGTAPDTELLTRRSYEGDHEAF